MRFLPTWPVSELIHLGPATLPVEVLSLLQKGEPPSSVPFRRQRCSSPQSTAPRSRYRAFNQFGAALRLGTLLGRTTHDWPLTHRGDVTAEMAEQSCRNGLSQLRQKIGRPLSVDHAVQA